MDAGRSSLDVLVTGAGGVTGRVLVHRLLRDGLGAVPVRRLVAVDLALRALPPDARLHRVEGSIADPAVLTQALADPVQVVFHLASLPGGAAERDPDLGRRVDLDATLQLLDRLRGQGGTPAFVSASTVAVFGESPPARVDEDTPAQPAMSHGAHKLAAEVLIADAARRGSVRCGCPAW